MKILKLTNYSFTTKIILIFCIFVIFFMLIRLILIIPQMEDESLKIEKDYIQRLLLMTKEQFLNMHSLREDLSLFEENLNKEKIEQELQEISHKLKHITNNELTKLIDTTSITNYCSYAIYGTNFYYESIKRNQKNKNDIFEGIKNKDILNQWVKYDNIYDIKHFITKEYFYYNYPINKNDSLLSLVCSKDDLTKNNQKLKHTSKEYIRTHLLIDSKLQSTKIALFWLNNKMINDKNDILFQEDKEKRRNLYNIMAQSNVKNLPTGNLTIQQILDARDKEPIEYTLDDTTVLTWIVDLNIHNNYLLLTYTVDKKELINKNRAKKLFILPEMVALGISFLFMLFLFRKMLNNINTLTKTATRVNQGETNIRSGIKGDDDIGILGKSFDSMLDSFEENIKMLDKKVKEKTKEISKSLEEKEILLKEIHHRVKNNLALTISLIELQEEEIDDEKTKKVLIDIQERIYTMELLHRKLYESTNLSQIALKNYVIDLITAISKTYDKEQIVHININVEDIDLNIETALPYGIVINELVTNAFKYAFTNIQNPKLDIVIYKQNKDEILLSIKDNGNGLDKNFNDLSTETLGLRLVNMIVKSQLMGDIYYVYDGGAKFVIVGKFKE